MAHINLTTQKQGTNTGDLTKPLSPNYSGLSVACSVDAVIRVKCLGMDEFVVLEDGDLSANQGGLFNTPLITEIQLVPVATGATFTYCIGQY